MKRLEESEKNSRELLSAQQDKLLKDINRIVLRSYPEEAQHLHEAADDLYDHVHLLKGGALTSSSFQQKFRTFFDHYSVRESHFISLVRIKESELQHQAVRLEGQRKVAESETARSRQLSTQVATFSQTETELRSQLNIYVEKFKQVEDTLNNSNDLFLTFRKEMEEMSKKTKRLEKENLNLTRKHDLTNRNILEMAEERTKTSKDLESLRKKNNTLESVIRQMQDQGRGPMPGMPLERDEDGTESDYDSEDDEAEYELGSEEGDYDEDTEEDLSMQGNANRAPATYGPVPPPPPPPPAAEHGHTTNGLVNGIVNGLQRPFQL